MTDKISVLVADDHAIVRRALISLLSLGENLEVVGEAADGREAVDLALKREPDVVLMDMSMPGLNGLEATRQIKKLAPAIKVLILSAYDNEEYVTQVVRSGANGYVLKNGSTDDLFAAIKSVSTGHAFFSPAVSKIIMDNYRKAADGPDAHSPSDGKTNSRLTPREREVLQRIVEGESHQKIAEILHISPRTVDTHCNNIMKKLDIHDTPSLVTYAIKNGILILPR